MAANRLAASQSPYLLQHASNPVDWWEWGPEALAEATLRDVPILLSVGYASCHWCHVMAHESFEDPQVAAFINEHFVAIKVDREERPDIDALYMRATQAMSGHGGWPMTCVLTPEGEPFFAGTYFGPEPRGDVPSFSQVLQSLAAAWLDRRDEVMQTADSVRNYLVDNMGDNLAPSVLTATDLAEAVRELAESFDRTDGGFGTAPKFPPALALEFLLRHSARTGDEQALQMAEMTCEKMARGGIYDQLCGGFARYAVDAKWVVPHFEKMLYDNAQLLRVYLHWWRQSGSDLARRVATETAEFIVRELQTDEGGFASALDADSDDREGTYYVWNPNQLMRALGVSDGAWATQLLGVTGAGTFERGTSTLTLAADPDDAERWSAVRTRLLERRADRTPPARDDKVVAGWNGLAISALSEASILLGRADFAAAALAAAEHLTSVHLNGDFVRTALAGQRSAHLAALDDHGLVAEAFIAVLGQTGDPIWLERARRLVDAAAEHFASDDGGFFDTSDQADQLLVRPRDVTDNVTPSGIAALAHAALALDAVTGEYVDLAQRCVTAAAELAKAAPRFAAWTLAAAESIVLGTRQVVVVGKPGAERDALHKAALLSTQAGVVIAGEPGTNLALFEGRGLIDGRAAAYRCRDFVCELPVTDPSKL
jgi:uncharacterized protein